MHIGTEKIDTKQLLTAAIQEVQNDGFTSVQLAHFGSVNQDLVNSLTVNVEEMMISAGDRKPLIKRVFSILIEGLQNILLHGERYDHEQLGLLIVASNENKYRIVLGNIALLAEQQKLIEYLNKLNHLSEEAVKAYYLETLNNGLMSAKGGAGLGFITMRMKSKAVLSYQFQEWSEDQSFFTISTDLDRLS